MEDLVTIRTFATRAEADLARSVLEAFGIECVVGADDCGGQRPALTMGSGVRLIARSKDVERAEEVLNGPVSEG